MTTQAELLALGEQNQKSNQAINAVMIAIAEAQMQARMALGSMGEQARIRREGVDFQAGYNIMLDNSDIVSSASKAATSMSLIAAHLMTLSCLLTQAGVDNSY